TTRCSISSGCRRQTLQRRRKPHWRRAHASRPAGGVESAGTACNTRLSGTRYSELLQTSTAARPAGRGRIKEVSTMAQAPVALAEGTVPVLSHWIDGRSVEVRTEQTAPVYAPATGAVIARVPRGGAAEVDAAVMAARRAFPAWSSMP